MAVEALRSGVPSPSAAAQVGTTQTRIVQAFRDSLEAAKSSSSRTPLVINGPFGSGKSHLLQCLSAIAHREDFVTSTVAIGPEVPLGYLPWVVRTLADASSAPNHVGCAIRELTPLHKVNRSEFAEFRLWLQHSPFDERFKALLNLYEEQYPDDEFRNRVTADFTGRPILATEIKRRLREIGQLSGYIIQARGSTSDELAEQRLQILARFFKSCGFHGWTVFLDELEVMGRFTIRQRMNGYLTLGIISRIAEKADSAFVPVIALTGATCHEVLTRDRMKIENEAFFPDKTTRELAMQGFRVFDTQYEVLRPSPDQTHDILYKIRSIYDRTYGTSSPEPNLRSEDAPGQMRGIIRKCIAQWDMARYYPQLSADVVEETLVLDQAEIPDEALKTGDEPD